MSNKKSKIFKDENGGHVRLYHIIQDSHAWNVLSATDIKLYLTMRRYLLAYNNGNIEATLGKLERHGITSSASLSKGLRALQAVGLIAKTRQGGIARGGKLCSLYRFTDIETFDIPKVGLKAMKPTNEWKDFKSKAEAKNILSKAHLDALRPTTKNKLKNHLLKPSESYPEAYIHFSDSSPEEVPSSCAHLLNRSDYLNSSCTPH